MCEIESINWVIVKSNKKISKKLSSKINKIRNASTVDNRIYFYALNPDAKMKVLELLKNYKYQRFEICEFYDKQYGLTLNFWKGGNIENFNQNVQKLPLSKKFYWNNPGSDLISVTPITNKQFKAIIKIN